MYKAIVVQVETRLKKILLCKENIFIDNVLKF